ncbi:MAG: hypothetical protein A3C43_12060 [Candidatus Schekmanbacteria bacterium RIFCSPHIGHO2_02_FULL_38_11]|nr:MAG: hypothetical protein A2043_06485 [Candidatus Schekmanbacteria bacterium GWA2_38_9]OGL50785.1 MAG: hypothetical protein A3H37_02940 [Candidatus Schekmanbacteria bacterium RIFCSPLOWO2_02_FULL_38_14]OGL55030.1 MAG: hypothetical protein A3C43_12060 [Candidatus Schekmanbacteria bacterium RIFCSPHIGHO2_02_FULL_38_11]
MTTIKQMRQKPIKLKAVFYTALSLIWIFATVALGHVVMVIINKEHPELMWSFGQWCMVVGFLFIVLTRFFKSDGWQSFFGVLGGTGMWISFEYGLIYGGERLGVSYTYNGSYPEYRMMQWSVGVLLMVCMYLMFQESVRCNLFAYLRRKLHLMRGAVATGKIDNYGPRTAFEYIMTTWFFYVLLIMGYDEAIFGAKGKFIYAVFFCSFAVAFYLAYKLLNFDTFGANLRYSIPVVLIFWNDIEILAKWGMLKEPWVHINWPIMLAIIFGFCFSSYLIYKDLSAKRSKETMPVIEDLKQAEI